MQRANFHPDEYNCKVDGGMIDDSEQLADGPLRGDLERFRRP